MTAVRPRPEVEEERFAAERRFDVRYGAAAGVVVAVAVLLRLWGDRSGLPWAYNVDEATNFVPRAIAMLGGNLNPGYFNNPPGFTYLLAGLYRLALGAAAGHVYHSNHSTEIWLIGRISSAVLGSVAVWLLYLAGARLFDRRAGLLAAGTLAVAFLPVFYGKLALNDSPTLAPVCLSLWGSAGILALGRRRDFAIAGIGLGLAAATKYTGGIVVLPLLVAAVALAVEEPERRRLVALWLPLGGIIALASFLALNPYALGDFHAFIGQLGQQSTLSGEVDGKLGLTHGSGIVYYLWTLTWGVGWVPAIAAAVGALALLARRWWWTFAALAPALIAYLAFMGVQGRYFGRWVMPIIPLVCLLAAFAVVSVADLAGRGRRPLRWALVALAACALWGQGAYYSVHSGIVNSRQDTRSIARSWLLRHVPAGTRLVVEPILPKAGGPPDDWTRPWAPFTDLLTHVGPRGILYVLAGHAVGLENYERTLSPKLVGLYLRDGYCWVLTGSTEEGRAQVDPRAVPRAIAYYRTLARDARSVHVFSPLARGASKIGFNFDWSFDYYPAAYVRPGPLVTIYHLRGGACSPAHHRARRSGRRHASRR